MGESLWDDDHSTPVLFLMPGILHFAQRHPLGVDAQFTATNVGHQLGTTPQIYFRSRQAVPE